MWERFKTIFLIGLVVLSLVLTHQLWFGPGAYEVAGEMGYEKIPIDDPRPLREVVVPERALISRDDGIYYRLGRGDAHLRRLWASMLHFLDENFTLISARQVAADDLEDDFVLCFSFSPPFPFYIEEDRSAILNLSLVGVREEAETMEIVLVTEQEEIFILEIFDGAQTASSIVGNIATEGLITYKRIGAGEATEAVEPEEPEEEDPVTDQRESDLGAEDPKDPEALEDGECVLHRIEEGLFVPSGVFSLPYLILEREDIDIDALVRRLFVDQRLVRRIEERGGAIIFTDGEKGLRLFSSGKIEHFAPKIERGPATMSYITALQRASEHLSFLGGWPAPLELDSLERKRKDYPYQREDHYHARWQLYIDGLPVLGDAVAVEMYFNDKGVGSYRRALYLLERRGEEEEIISYEQAAKVALEHYHFIQEEEGAEPVITDIYLAYYLRRPLVSPQQKALPVWVVEVDERIRIIINAHNSRVESEQE